MGAGGSSSNVTAASAELGRWWQHFKEQLSQTNCPELCVVSTLLDEAALPAAVCRDEERTSALIYSICCSTLALIKTDKARNVGFFE